MKLTPKLTEIYGSIQEKRTAGLDNQDMDELLVELQEIGGVLAEIDDPMWNLGIVPREAETRKNVPILGKCPCCGRPLED